MGEVKTEEKVADGDVVYKVSFKRLGLSSQLEFKAQTVDQVQAALPLLDDFLTDIGAEASISTVSEVAAPAPKAVKAGGCADCGKEVEGTRGGGGFKPMTADEIIASRRAKLEDDRNGDVLKGMDTRSRDLCSDCWRPYRKAIETRFKK